MIDGVPSPEIDVTVEDREIDLLAEAPKVIHPDGREVEAVLRDAIDVGFRAPSSQQVSNQFVPGDAFGDPRGLRLSYACSQEDIVKGMDRITEGFSRLRR